MLRGQVNIATLQVLSNSPILKIDGKILQFHPLEFYPFYIQ